MCRSVKRIGAALGLEVWPKICTFFRSPAESMSRQQGEFLVQPLGQVISKIGR